MDKFDFCTSQSWLDFSLRFLSTGFSGWFSGHLIWPSEPLCRRLLKKAKLLFIVGENDSSRVRGTGLSLPQSQSALHWIFRLKFYVVIYFSHIHIHPNLQAMPQTLSFLISFIFSARQAKDSELITQTFHLQDESSHGRRPQWVPTCGKSGCNPRNQMVPRVPQKSAQNKKLNTEKTPLMCLLWHQNDYV